MNFAEVIPIISLQFAYISKTQRLFIVFKRIFPVVTLTLITAVRFGTLKMAP